MNKRFFTVLLAIGFASLAFGQVPMVVKGEMKNVGTMKAGGTVHMRATSGTAAQYGVLVNEGAIVLEGGLTLASNDENDALLFNDYLHTGTITFTNPVDSRLDVKVIKTFEKGRFYYFSMPFDVNIKDIKIASGEVSGTKGVYYDKTAQPTGYWVMGWYNAQRRAETGIVGTGYWNYFTLAEYNAEQTLVAGKSYLIYIDDEFDTANGSKITFEFPAKDGTAVTNLYSDGVKNIPLQFFSDPASNQSHWGWNVVGDKHTANFQLFVSNMALGGFSGDVNGGLKGLYLYKSAADIWELKDLEEEDFQLSPYGAYFIQVGGSNPSALVKGALGFLELYPEGLGLSHEVGLRSSLVSKRDVLVLQLSLDGEVTDKLTVKQSEEYNNIYSLGEDNPKLFNTAVPQFYTILEETPMIINRYHSITEAIPMGLTLNKSGEYSIGISKLTGFEGHNILLEDREAQSIFVLYDNETDTYTDYEFTSNPLTDNTRYALRITNVPTSISTQDSNVVIYVSNNRVYVANLKAGDNVSIYDVAGKLVSQNKTESSSVSYPLAGPGVYVIKVTGSQTVISKVINQAK